MKTSNHKMLILVIMIFIILLNSCDDNSTSIENTSDDVIADIDGNEYKIIKIGG